MKVDKNKLYDALRETFLETIEKVKTEDIYSLSDMYVCVKYDDLSMLIYDDAMTLILQTTIDDLDILKEEDSENFDECVEVSLRKVLGTDQMKAALESLDTVGPFSVILIGEDQTQLSELVTIDKDTVFLDDDFLKNIDKELDDFFEKLMSDVK